MTKRILSLLLAAMMVLGSIIVVSAAEEEIDYDVENAFAIDVLKDINVLQGYDEDDFALDAAIKRYEMSLFIARALTGKTKDTYWEGAKNETPFTDLDGFKYAGSTTWTYNHGIILGKDNNTFDPNGYITYQEAIAMVLRAWADYYVKGGLKTLGIDDSIHYPWRHIELVEYLGLDVNVDPETKYTDVLSRGAVAQLIFNLLTWSSEGFEALETKDFQFATDATMAEEKFGLELSPAEGVLVEILDDEADEETGILDNQVVEFTAAGKAVVGEVEGLTADHFADFEVEVEEDVYYNIVYFTRHEVEYNPFTGEAMIVEDGDVVTVVLSIEKVSIDDLVYTNAYGEDAEYKVEYAATHWKDDGSANGWSITGIVAGDVTYPVTGDDALKVRIMTGLGADNYKVYTQAEFWGTDGSDKDEIPDGLGKEDDAKAVVNALTPLYADLRVEDTNGDGEVDTLTVVPYVFAAVYSEVETDATDDGKTTTWKFDNYAVVLLDETQATGTAFPTVDKDGEKVANPANITGKLGAAYIAKDSATMIKEADVIDIGVISFFDIRAGKTNYITIDGVKYDYKYDALKGWNIEAGYYDVATSTDKLTTLYANNTAEDDEFVADGSKLKYISAWIIDNKVVGLITVKPTGEQVTTPTTPETKYAGIMDIPTLPHAANYADVNLDATFIKNVNGKYYLMVDAYVDGVYVDDALVYLADATTFSYVAGSGTQQSQINLWEAREEANILDAYKLIAEVLAGKNAFYNLDEHSNYVITFTKDPSTGTYATDVVNGENYVKYVGGNTLVTLGKEGTNVVKYVDGAITYYMDYNSDDYISYNWVDTKDATNSGIKYVGGIANGKTQWIFVGDNGTQNSSFGVPEKGSLFISNDLATAKADAYSVIKKGDAIIVFVDDASKNVDNEYMSAKVDGFMYSMHADAVYALVDGSTELLNDYVRDGYYYFTAHKLFDGSEMIIRVEEETMLASELLKIDADGVCRIVAVTGAEDDHSLLETYKVNDIDAIAAIFADTVYAPEATGNGSVLTKAILESGIKNYFKMTTLGQVQMSTLGKNLVYVVTKEANGEYVATLAKDGWPLLPEDCKFYAFYTPAAGKDAAKYVAFVMAEDKPVNLGNALTAALASGKVTLTENIGTALAPEVLNVTSSATINLNGFTINGGINVATGAKVVINGSDIFANDAWTRTDLDLNVTVDTGAEVVIKNIDLDCVTVNGTGKATVENSHVDNVVAAAGATVVVKNSIVKDAATAASGADVAGIYLSGAAVTVEGTTVTGKGVQIGTTFYNPRAIYGTAKGATIKNATLGDGTGYAFNLNGTDATADLLVVTGSTFKGWTSYSNWKSASFTDSTFDGQLKPYVATTLKNCDISKAVLDAGDGLTVTITLDGCKVNGVVIPALAKDATAEQIKAVEDVLRTLVSAENGEWNIGVGVPATLKIVVGEKVFTFAGEALTTAAIPVADVATTNP